LRRFLAGTRLGGKHPEGGAIISRVSPADIDETPVTTGQVIRGAVTLLAVVAIVVVAFLSIRWATGNVGPKHHPQAAISLPAINTVIGRANQPAACNTPDHSTATPTSFTWVPTDSLVDGGQPWASPTVTHNDGVTEYGWHLSPGVRPTVAQAMVIDQAGRCQPTPLRSRDAPDSTSYWYLVVTPPDVLAYANMSVSATGSGE
jgi:hypothetical protein